ncbi:uncharacterized protein DNG_01861 [Cephalotrichum gorgonifer]|uniref:Uncharacterized protein n=1 Tax=Cephalotrichum gorgonifer TaxID=2041049 RepID=A0AAE8MSK1_9PEZI|nr:uncharacterized protein DNG_01861 [Cephalotrichum gorgonifer]
MENYRQSYKGDDSSDDDDIVPAMFPPTYPALSRGGSRTRSRVKADAAQEITSTMVRLQDRNPQKEKVSGRIAGRDVEDMWSDLRAKREDIYSLRLEMTQQRESLRELRRRKDDADNKMLSMVRQVLPRLGDALRVSFAETEALRSEYATQENFYEAREVRLDELEVELVQSETQFFLGLSQRTGADTRRVFSAAKSDSGRAKVPLELMGISPDGPPEDIHPLYRQFQKAVGEFGLASESLHELLGARAEIDFKLTIDRHLEMERLDEEEREFLSEYEKEEKKRSTKLQKARGRVAYLRKACEDQGVMLRHLSFDMVYILRTHFPTEGDDGDDMGEDIVLGDNASPSTGLARPFLPRLMSQEAHLFGKFPVLPPEALEAAEGLPLDTPHRQMKVLRAQEEVELYHIFSSCPEHNVSAFVNRWLLHQLRISPHIGHLLYNLTMGEDDGMSNRELRQWQEYMLESWWGDDAPQAKEPEGSTRARHGGHNGSEEQEKNIASSAEDLAVEGHVDVKASFARFLGLGGYGQGVEIPVSSAVH